MGSNVCEDIPKGALLRIKLFPKSSRDEVYSKVICFDGVNYLKVSTTSVPQDNEANSTLIKIISKKFKLAKSSISIIKGNKSQYKVLLLENTNSEKIYTELGEICE